MGERESVCVCVCARACLRVHKQHTDGVFNKQLHNPHHCVLCACEGEKLLQAGTSSDDRTNTHPEKSLFHSLSFKKHTFQHQKLELELQGI